MNRILANIKSVKGVSGIIVVDKTRALTYEVLPASFSNESKKNISLPLLHLGQSTTSSASMDFFFENGLARIYNRSEFILLILGREDMNFNMLGVICREAIPAITRKLRHGQIGYSDSTKTSNQNVGTDFLLKAINIISTNCVDKVGAYIVTKYLRQAKDEISGRYRILTSVTVDNNGVASFIKGAPQKAETDTLTAFAHWSNLYLSYLAKSTNKLNPEDIMELTIEIKDKLNLTGFYQLYSDIEV